MSESICGYMSGRLMPHGFVVAALIFRMCSRSKSTVMVPAPISPKPPALLTAAAKRQPLHHAMPPAMTGYFMPNMSSILFIAAAKVQKKVLQHV